MIISASRRTDIPACYSEWFFNRIKEKYVFVPNPMNIHQVSKVSLSPDVVDCIVFWTKNPLPMIGRLNELKDFCYYFQFTVNSYSEDVEPNVPCKDDVIIPTFKRLSDKIGAQRVILRYDPIFLSKKYTVDYHIENFDKILRQLKDCTEKCTISFIDLYRKTVNNVKKLGLIEMTVSDKRKLACELSKIALSYGLKMDTCAEEIDLSEYNISHGKCIDDELIEQISGFNLDTGKDVNQRQECGCVSSVDIGMYNTCTNGCRYCYANYSADIVKRNFEMHDSKSPLMYGQISCDDIIKERIMKSCKKRRLNLF